MPISLTIQLQGEEGHRHGSYLASLMQGALMERIDPTYADYLHRTGAHPYSQNVQTREGHILWTINALSDDAERYIIRPILESRDEQILLTHRQETMQIISKSIDRLSYDELVQKYYLGSCSRKLTLQFLTPTSFKQAGRYCLFPTGRLIFQSLMQRYDAGAEDSSIFSEDLVEEFEQYTEITDYKLRSTRYSMESVKIPSFIGECTIRIKGPQQMVNVAHMLAQFGRYSGVGIKTGLGMGALDVKERLSVRKEQNSADSRIKQLEQIKKQESGVSQHGRSAD